MQTILPPYALPAIGFPFRHLAALAGRAPIGGAREVALGCFLAARLAAERRGVELAEGVSAARGTASRSWLGTLALPAPVRGPLGRTLDLAATGSLAELAEALRVLARAAHEYLDGPARGEMEALVAQLSA